MCNIFVLITDASCPDGKFGWKCQFQCGCKNNATCDSVTGSCQDGCKLNRYGPGCLLGKYQMMFRNIIWILNLIPWGIC